MSRCYVCDHSLVAICARCGSELTISDTRGTETMRDEATEFRVVPCDCDKMPEAGSGDSERT